MGNTIPHLDSEGREQLFHEIEASAHLLPAQGPISVFVHHNTLHAFENDKFLDAVNQGARIFGCHPFLSEDEFRVKMAAGEFGLPDLEAALIDDLGELDDELIASLGTRFGLRFAMLAHPLHIAPSAELNWLIVETDALRKFRPETPADTKQRVMNVTRRWILAESENGAGSGDNIWLKTIRRMTLEYGPRKPADWSSRTWEAFTLQLLWLACEEGARIADGSAAEYKQPVRHRDLLYQATGVDADLPVHELLIRFTAAFLDQGFSQWTLPSRAKGYFTSFLQLYADGWIAPNEVLLELKREARRLRQGGFDAVQSIVESLELMGVAKEERGKFLDATALSLRGWAGMIHQVESRGDRAPQGIPTGTLTEFLAVRLILDRLACARISRSALGWTGPLSALRSHLEQTVSNQVKRPNSGLAFTLFQIAQVRGWAPEALLRISKADWGKLVREVEAFNSVERRKVFQLAFERSYRQQMLDAYVAHTRKYWLPKFKHEGATAPRPKFQIVCCIDDREESFRRYLEELEPRCETFGAAGFFCAPMYYRGAADAHFVPLCPIILKPDNYVVEQVADDLQESHGRRAKLRRSIGRQVHAWHLGSRTFLGGLATAIVGPIATIPLVMRVLFPAWTARFRRAAGQLVLPPRQTHLKLERQVPVPGKDGEGIGFTLAEMVDAVERLLRDIGLTWNMSRLVVICGHGSASLNNPHESAYNCGACGGGRGGPNARAIAAMANDPRVRQLLRERGLELPEDTVFLGAFHNTCDDSIQISDLSRLPNSHREDLEHFVSIVNMARELNAQERCRRFVSAPLSLSPSAALRHVEERSEDLSQTRPEYNHATNAICTVGRRSRTRGLFLDRRSFLVSYDPRQDDDQTSILTRILSAVVPVCAGINLEYYFSRVDVAGYGCGTKLPHNVTSLLGVMDGAASDLRTGLSAQMVEIHDPVRLLFIIETQPEQFLKVMEKVPVIERLCANGWVQVAILSPQSDEIHLLRGRAFQKYQPKGTPMNEVRKSVDWYRGTRENVGPAHVLAGLSPVVTAR